MTISADTLPALVAGALRGDAVAAFGCGRRPDVTRDEIACAVEHVASRLALEARGARVLLLADDVAAFGAGLLGIWRAGAVAVLAPNAERETLSRIEPGVASIVTDRATPGLRARHIEIAWSPERRDRVHEPGAAPGWSGARDAAGAGARDGGTGAASAADASALRGDTVDVDAPALELFTSGTTGSAKSVTKPLRVLAAEVAVLEELFGPMLGEARIFATAAAHHLYGLLFRVLLPLATGRAFQRETLLYPEELLPRLAESEAAALVGTPAHLRGLVAHPRLASLRGRCRAVFSSGGPLSDEVASRLHDALGVAPIEILGSTETGGVAMRRAGEDAGFVPLPGVAVERDAASGRARVRSPFLCERERAAGFLLGDRIRFLDDGRFRVEGRDDRVLKIGEKRLCLDEMEQRLAAHDAVEEAALVAVERAGTTRVAALIVPAERERTALARGAGEDVLRRALADHLAAAFDRVLLPRVWRFVGSLPRDERGKTSAGALREIVARSRAARTEPGPSIEAAADERAAAAAGADVRRASEPRAASTSEARAHSTPPLRIPPDLPFFDGHFPGHPVVPGVVQLGWAIEAARAIVGASAVLAAVEGWRLPSPIEPGAEVQVTVEPIAGGVAFRVHDGERTFSSGRLRFAPAEGAA